MGDGPDGGKPRRDSGRNKVQSIGGYDLISRLGQGGMGAVYKARQQSMDRVIALKILPPKLAKNRDFVTRFLREARAASPNSSEYPTRYRYYPLLADKLSMAT